MIKTGSSKIYKYAKACGIENPKVIGWDFPRLSVEQINVFRMHGYTAAWILPDGLNPDLAGEILIRGVTFPGVSG